MTRTPAGIAENPAEIPTQLPARWFDNYSNASAALPQETQMNLKTLTPVALTHALAAAMEAVKMPGSANLQRTRQKALFALKQEAQRRINLGAF